MSQRSTVLEALREAGERGICLADVPIDVGYAMRNRIGDLRAAGMLIRGERCRIHAHRGQIERYFLVTQPVQMAIAL